MVKLAINIISGCYNTAKDWTLGQLENPFGVDKAGLTFAINNRAMVMPIDPLIKAFHKAGYGPKATEKWINCYNDLGFLKWNFTSGTQRYVCFTECPINEKDIEKIRKCLKDKEKKEEQIMKDLKEKTVVA